MRKLCRRRTSSPHRLEPRVRVDSRFGDLERVSPADGVGATELVHFDLADAAHAERYGAQLNDAVHQSLLHFMDRSAKGRQEQRRAAHRRDQGAQLEQEVRIALLAPGE